VSTEFRMAIIYLFTNAETPPHSATITASTLPDAS